MPPKSKAVKAAATTKKPRSEDAKPAKAAKVEVAPVKSGGARPKIDPNCSVAGQIYQDADGVNWSVSLNQTNIGQNNNKFYIIQLIEKTGGGYACFTKWGRVGETGANATTSGDLDASKKQFSAKFKDKTSNNWDSIRSDHTGFKKIDGKYMLIETAADDEDSASTSTKPAVAAATAPAAGPVPASKLEPHLQKMLKLIFDKDMFKNQMAAQKIDANKMPLGKLTKEQVESGYKALEAIEDAVKKGASAAKLADLCSAFYTVIPHDFGRAVPPVIRSAEEVAQKYDLLNMLNDIQIAVAMDAKPAASVQENPLDRQYRELNCKLDYVDPKSDEFKIIDNYTKNTQGYRKCTIVDAFRVDRPEDKSRIAQFADVKHRKLLWHGTNVAVVAAIVKTGLRILPSSGGRVGKGIYFASENGKSAGYVRCEGTTGFMFLVEVVLGDAKEINRDDSTLTYNKVVQTLKKDSIIARGWTEPDPKNDIQIQGEWQPITVPQGPVIDTTWKSNSSFTQSEYLIYQESRARIKYVLKMNFSY